MGLTFWPTLYVCIKFSGGYTFLSSAYVVSVYAYIQS